MIYTSYFANHRNLDQSLVHVSVARRAPKWFKGPSHPALAPTKDLLWRYKNGRISPDGYREEFMAQLEKLEVRFVGKLCSGEVLLCWEGPGKFCHRELVREWLVKYGFDCEEVKL